jgi:Domain of unknown function (DUF5916)/Carbohydrate family 9 binding domain-like
MPQIRVAMGVSVAVVTLSSLGLAQQDSGGHRAGEASSPGQGGTIVAAEATMPVRLDGRLDEQFWAGADSIVDFRQREPAEGQPGTEATVIKVAQDGQALYVAVRASDRDVAGIRATQLRRDADLTVDDYVTLLLDSFRDRRGAFLFRTNPNGAMWDAQLNGLDDVNANWNGIWNVAVSRDSGGWSAEFRIPFRTLRFHRGANGFGFNVERFIRRKNEEVLWRSFGRVEGLLQLLKEGEITGLVGLRRGRGLELRPYALARATADDHDLSGTSLGGGGVSAKAGADAKLPLSPTVTADITVNTDFAQVEADSEAINLTRFPLFFPEKREFFLESSGIFDFGTPERAQLFYSRRIGLREGEPVPILGGARVYGRVGRLTIGGLDARTGHLDEANSLVLRVKHDLFARGYVGAIAMQRAGPGVPTGPERAAGIDVDLPLVIGGRNLEPSFWIAGTSVPGTQGTPVGWRVATDYPNDLFDNFVSLYQIDAGFAPTLGFVRRVGIRETTGHIDFMPRPGVLGIRQLDLVFPIPSWDIIADESGSLLRSHDWQTATFEWRPLGGSFQSGAQFEVNLQRFLDAPTDTFEIFPGVKLTPNRYWWTRAELQYFSSPGHPLSAGSIVSFGDFYDGTDTEITLTGTWRGGGHVILGASATRSSVRLPAGRFSAEQASGRMEYAFNTRADFLAFVQYNNEDQRVDFNLRFHWIPAVGDDVFVVWNSGYTTDPLAPHRFPSPHVFGSPLHGGLVVKVVHRLVM